MGKGLPKGPLLGGAGADCLGQLALGVGEALPKGPLLGGAGALLKGPVGTAGRWGDVNGPGLAC